MKIFKTINLKNSVEGYMGYLDSLHTHPPTALKQITTKLKASKQGNDYLDPLLLYELSTKEKHPDSNIYELTISNRIISNEILNFIRYFSVYLLNFFPYFI